MKTNVIVLPKLIYDFFNKTLKKMKKEIKNNSRNGKIFTVHKLPRLIM